MCGCRLLRNSRPGLSPASNFSFDHHADSANCTTPGLNLHLASLQTAALLFNHHHHRISISRISACNAFKKFIHLQSRSSIMLTQQTAPLQICSCCKQQTCSLTTTTASAAAAAAAAYRPSSNILDHQLC